MLLQDSRREARTGRRRARPARGPGPLALGRAEDRRGPAAARARALAPPARAVPAPGRDRGAARAGADARGDGLAADRRALRRARGRHAARRSSSSTAPSRSRWLRAGGGPRAVERIDGLDELPPAARDARRPAAPARAARGGGRGVPAGARAGDEPGRARVPRAAARGGRLSAFPIIYVADVRRSAEFYERAFGFERTFEWFGEEGDFVALEARRLRARDRQRRGPRRLRALRLRRRHRRGRRTPARSSAQSS